MLNASPLVIVARIITLVIAFTIHEFAHAWTATELGDDTARYQGRLTLNPLRHLDPLGSLLLVLVGFGWAKPVPFNPHNLRYGPRTGTALVAVAGPLSNFLMALIAAIPLRFDLLAAASPFAPMSLLRFASGFLQVFIFTNLVLMFFNLIPLPPLDGHKVATGVLPYQFAEIFYRLEPWGPFILLALLFGAPYLGIDVLGFLIGAPTRTVFDLLVG